jgi:hypothetical protein
MALVKNLERLKSAFAGLLSGVLFLFLISFLVSKFLNIKVIYAASSPWSQTNWNGGQSNDIVNSTTTTYNSQSSLDLSSAGQFSLSSVSGWFNPGWRFRKSVTVSNSNASTLSNYQIRIPVTYVSDMQTDFDDVRFTSDSGTELNYWLDYKVDSSRAVFWVKVPSLPNGNTTIYMYYGNADVSSTSSGENTFVFFDSFSGTTLDSTKWSLGGTTTDFSVNNKLISTAGSCGGWDRSYISSKSTFDRTNGYIMEMGYKPTGWTSAGCVDGGATMFGWHSGSSSISYASMVHCIYDVWSGDVNTVYENGGGLNPGSPYNSSLTINQDYALKITALPTAVGGAKYYLSTDKGENFANFANTSSANNSPLRLAATIYNQNFEITNWRIRNYAVTEPSVVLNNVEGKYSSSGTLTSNIFNAEFPADWGNLTYTSSGDGTTVLRVRTGNQADLSDASSWSSCSIVTNGSDISDNDCVDDQDQYIQYQVTLGQSDGSTPVFQDVSIGFTASDKVRPVTNASSVSLVESISGSWINSKPTISWNAGADNDSGSGVAGYCISLEEASLGNSTNLDPETSSGILTGLNDGVSNLSTCGYIVVGNSINLASISGLNLTNNKQYYFSIKTVDIAGNVWSGNAEEYQNLVTFKYDSNPPSNVSYISTPGGVFSNVADMSFSWPVSPSSSAATDAESTLLGYQYQLNSTSGTWQGTDNSDICNLDYIPVSNSSYDLTQGDDGANIDIGNNIVYFRAIDKACNPSSPATYRTGNLSYGGSAPNFGGDARVTITPSTGTANLFEVSWPSATATEGQNVTEYFYMINTTPPITYETLIGNDSTYFSNGVLTTFSARALPNVNKGTNTIYVVAVDDDNNYSPSNYISGSFVLNSNNPDNVRNLIASDSSIKSEEQWNVTLTWIAPVYQGAGNLSYLVLRSSDGQNFSQVGSTSGLSYVDNTPLSATYYYKVFSKDGANAQSSGTNSVSITPTGKWTSAPSIEDAPSVSDITTKKATIGWSTNRTADSKISYGKSSGDYFDEEPSNAGQVTAHEINLTNLDPGTKYYYVTKWTDEDGNTGISDEQTFKTENAPSVEEAKTINVGINSVILQFTSLNAYKVKIYYGKSTAFGAVKEISTGKTKGIHTVQLDQLEDQTKYYFKLNTYDLEDSEYEGDVNSFETLPKPRVSSVRLQEVKGSAQPSVLVTWETNTELSSIVTYAPASQPDASRDEIDLKLIKGPHKLILRGLLPNSPYVLSVRGRDKQGNEAESTQQRFTTSTDTRPPQIVDLFIEPSIASVSSDGNTVSAQLVVTWNTDEPSTSQVEFGEGTGTTYSQKTQQDTNLTTNHLVVVSGLTPSKVYHLRAMSADTAGNSTNSVDTVTITPKSTDNALDLVVTNIGQIFNVIGSSK